MLRQSFIRYVSFIFYISCLFILTTRINAQCLSKQNIWDSLDAISINENLSGIQKLQQFYNLKKISEKCYPTHDSVYCKILLKIGVTEIQANKNYNTGLGYLQLSLNINASLKKSSSVYMAAKDFYALGYYYDQLGFSIKALNYFDSCITTASIISSVPELIFSSKISKANIYFQIGDYQKAVEENIEGMHYSLQKNDSIHFLGFLIQRAQSLFYEDETMQALSDVNAAIKTIEKKSNNNFSSAIEKDKYNYQYASALKIKAFIFQKQQQYANAKIFFEKAIALRILTKSYQQTANDYIDFGNFYLDSLHDYINSKQCYLQTSFYGKKLDDSLLLSKANTNLAEIYLKQKKYDECLFYNNEAFKYLNIDVQNNILYNPTIYQLKMVGMKELGLVILSNKVQTLIALFLKNRNKTVIDACVKTCLVTDSLITEMRNTQSGNESKLYWRNYTRNFYANAINASYISNNADLTFYFMEKSRAVLLNDKLNELDASSQLSETDANKQESYEINIVELEQKLSLFSDKSKQYQDTQLKLIATRKQLVQFIISLEQKYPTYYQYKYDDKVPSLKDLQNYLATNNQCFVHYFFGDTATYILAITANKTNFIRLSQKDFNKEQLSDFIKLCADKQALNNNYTAFAQLSNSIYKKIFQPLQLPKGRIIICTDNAVIPFDALCSDVYGKNFLLNDYSFSYVYSARSLMRQFKFSNPKGNFVGFAPVSFEKYLHVQDLKNAASALEESATYYTTDKLFTHQTATRNNFFNYASSYSVVNIFSHARADTTGNEPVLFMQDSLIHLSELQLLTKPATQLVLLSACQTNVGKAATGEGIYSLARGFATAGIPSVSATLWKADEQAIYAISQKFNEYLSEDMNKDEALQKAKLYFVQNNSTEKLLPYYWANMILIGNADALKLSNSSSTNYLWIIGVVAIVLLISIIFIIRKKPF